MKTRPSYGRSMCNESEKLDRRWYTSLNSRVLLLYQPIIALVCTKGAGRNLCRTAHLWAVQDSSSLERSARDGAAFTVNDYRFPTDNIRAHPTGEDTPVLSVLRLLAAWQKEAFECLTEWPCGDLLCQRVLYTCYVQICVFCTSPASIIIRTRRDFFDTGFTGHNPSPPRSLPAKVGNSDPDLVHRPYCSRDVKYVRQAPVVS